MAKLTVAVKYPLGSFPYYVRHRKTRVVGADGKARAIVHRHAPKVILACEVCEVSAVWSDGGIGVTYDYKIAQQGIMSSDADDYCNGSAIADESELFDTLEEAKEARG